MKHDNLPFQDALQYLAKKAGIKIPDSQSGSETSANRERLFRLNEEALKYFMQNLNNSRSAMTYLRNRGISDESIQKFSLGYATDQRDDLCKLLKKTGLDDPFLLKTGLIVSHEMGYRDLFRKRIMFPIFSLKNDVIAFGGRVMDDSLPKYINSPETEVFKKGETLFAINLSKDEIRKKGYAIIVEGYLDAIMCHQYAFLNTVAPLGTALTSRQLQKLKSLAKKAVLVFDSDEAGIAAARRSMTILCENDFAAKVLLLPKGEDPDSYLKKNGSQAFRNQLSNASSVITFLLNTSKGNRHDTVREALSVIASSRDLILADEMLGELADSSGIHETVLRSELEKIKKKPFSQPSEKSKPSPAASNREEYLLLSAVISFPEKVGYVLSMITDEDLHDNTVASLFHKIRVLEENLSLNSLLNASDDNERALLTKLTLKPEFDVQHVDKNIEDCLNTMKMKNYDERRKKAEKSGDRVLLNALLKEKRKLAKRISL
jgi:DNA primase